MKVVPEPSERCTRVILASGRVTPGLASAMALSFHCLILPRKMSASRVPLRRSWPGCRPSRFTTGTTPPMADGNWPRPAWASSSVESGLSEEPKSTVPALIWAMPPPEPMDW
ncbi:hypothetical protein D3C81_1652470 [compost metagenome]